MGHPPVGHSRHRVGRWLPHQDALDDWLEGLVADVGEKAAGAKLHPAVGEFRTRAILLVDALPQPENPDPPLVLLGTRLATAR
jgi:hypothetical protein